MDFFNRLFYGIESRILMLGLDDAGKTTTLVRFNIGDFETVIPTIGFVLEIAHGRGIHVTSWDVGGADYVRPLWRHYYKGIQGLIFVINSNDHERLDSPDYFDHSSKGELHRLLKEDELRNCPLLIYANKQDLPNALNVSEISERLGINEIRTTRLVHVQGCCATTRDGIQEGLHWLVNAIREGNVSPPSESPPSESPPSNTNTNQCIIH